MESVVVPLVPDIRNQQDKEGQADGKSGDADEAEDPVFFDISRGDFYIIGNQNRSPVSF